MKDVQVPTPLRIVSPESFPNFPSLFNIACLSSYSHLLSVGRKLCLVLELSQSLGSRQNSTSKKSLSTSGRRSWVSVVHQNLVIPSAQSRNNRFIPPLASPPSAVLRPLFYFPLRNPRLYSRPSSPSESHPTRARGSCASRASIYLQPSALSPSDCRPGFRPGRVRLAGERRARGGAHEIRIHAPTHTQRTTGWICLSARTRTWCISSNSSSILLRISNTILRPMAMCLLPLALP